MSTRSPLPRTFFARDTATVARALLGCIFWTAHDHETASGRIVEVEAYLGEDDPASHAGRGPTPRSAIMFGPPGFAYVYLIYGMHHCVNAVTEPRGKAGAVLVRALEPLSGLETMARRSPGIRQTDDLCRGPGRLCRALGIDLAWSGVPLAGPPAGRRREERRVWITAPDRPAATTGATPRVGVNRAADRLLRFIDTESPCVSKPY